VFLRDRRFVLWDKHRFQGKCERHHPVQEGSTSRSPVDPRTRTRHPWLARDRSTDRPGSTLALADLGFETIDMGFRSPDDRLRFRKHLKKAEIAAGPVNRVEPHVRPDRSIRSDTRRTWGYESMSVS
jgi:hypothetical protein